MDTAPHGFLIVDKPPGLTSRAVVDRAARWFPRRTRLGHTGTLDPLATGVLVLAVGQATRLTEYVQRMEKVYRAGIVLGATSDTDDADGTITPAAGADAPARDEVERCLASMTGTIAQTPPAYSAAKVAGRRAYDLARRGAAVELAPRSVQIYDIQILGYDYPHLDLEVRCGKGTYIRSLARDLGEQLGCGGYIAALRRTRVGPFAVEAGVTLDVDRAIASAALLEMAWAVNGMPRVELPLSELDRFRQGQAVPVEHPPALGEAAVWAAGRFVGIARCDEQGMLQPAKVIG